MGELELLSVVALLEDSNDQKLLRGQVGTIVERLVPAVYEVEFSDDEGRTYASLCPQRGRRKAREGEDGRVKQNH